MSTETIEKRTPSETLMEALTEIDDKRHAIVVMAGEDGTITVMHSVPLAPYEFKGAMHEAFEVVTEEWESNDD